MNSLQEKLLSLATTTTGFSASEVTGHSPEHVRRSAEALVKSGELVRMAVSSRRIRYFRDDAAARRFVEGRNSGRIASASRSLSAKATWRVDEPGIITAQTKIYRAPPLPDNVYRTNTYPQF